MIWVFAILLGRGLQDESGADEGEYTLFVADVVAIEQPPKYTSDMAAEVANEAPEYPDEKAAPVPGN
jgi:hypothetical protein